MWQIEEVEKYIFVISGLTHYSLGAHYSERQDKPSSLQIQRLVAHLKLNCECLFLPPWALMG